MDPKERTLLNNLKNRDTADKAFSSLVELYQEKLYWHIRKIVVTHDNANDVLQNTFIRVFRSINNFKGNSQLLTWMFRIAYNESLRFLEKDRKLKTSSGTDSIEYLQALQQDPHFDGDEIQHRLHKALGSLSEKQRRVFNMKYFDDLNFRQMAEITGIAENTLKSAYYSAVKIIEEKMIN